jgi:hypothetical protein
MLAYSASKAAVIGMTFLCSIRFLVEQKIDIWRHLFSHVISDSMPRLRLNYKGTLSRIRMLEPFDA